MGKTYDVARFSAAGRKNRVDAAHETDRRIAGCTGDFCDEHRTGFGVD